MTKFVRFLLLITAIHFASCEGKKESLPSYITVNDIDFEYKNIDLVGNGGTAITDVWFYRDGSLDGVFQLPATIAVPAEGDYTIRIGPGIKLNGISSTREQYTYFVPYEENVTLSPLDTVTIEPIVSYYAETGISFKEEFQDVVVGLDTIASSDVSFDRVFVENQPAYIDGYCGYAEITTAAPGLKVITKDLFMVPIPATLPVYLEMDYKINQDITVGVIVQNPTNGIRESQLINLRSTVEGDQAKWKHIYIDLTDFIQANSADATGFGLSFTAFHVNGFTSGKIYLDNVKVVNQTP